MTLCCGLDVKSRDKQTDLSPAQPSRGMMKTPMKLERVPGRETRKVGTLTHCNTASMKISSKLMKDSSASMTRHN